MRIDFISDHLPQSGAGVIEARLERELSDLGCSVQRRLKPQATAIQRLKAPPLPDCDVRIVLQSPTPLRLGPGRKIAIIFDLRYLQTRGVLGKLYRATDLIRTVQLSDEIFTISTQVKHQLEAIAQPSSISILPLGPGQFDDVDLGNHPRPKATFLLIGGAPHKQNELAVDLLGYYAATCSEISVTAIGLASELEGRLATFVEPSRLRLRHGIAAAEMRIEMQSHRYFLHCGVSEGLGFPYLEAASSGCIPLVRDYGVTREIFGDGGLYLPEGDLPKSLILTIDESRFSENQARIIRTVSPYRWGRLGDFVLDAVVGPQVL